MAKTPTWQRAAGKNPEGGLNEAGRRSLRAAGHDIKRPQPEGGPRKKSFCARMKGMKAQNTSAETANDPNSRINKSLRKWKCADGGDVTVENALRLARKGDKTHLRSSMYADGGQVDLYDDAHRAEHGATPAVDPVTVTEHYAPSTPQADMFRQSYNEAVPFPARALMAGAAGVHSPMTEKDVTPEDRAEIIRQTDRQRKLNNLYESDLANQENLDPESLKALQSFQKTRGKTSVTYDPSLRSTIYDPNQAGLMQAASRAYSDPSYRIGTTLGSYNVYDTPKGRIVLDKYDFDMPNAASKNIPVSASDFSKNFMKSLRIAAPQYAPDIVRPVAINLDAKPNRTYEYTGPAITTPSAPLPSDETKTPGSTADLLPLRRYADGGDVTVDNALRMARNMGGGALYNQLNYALNSPTPANPPQDPGPQQPYYQSLPQTRDMIQQYGSPAPQAPSSSPVRQPMPYAKGGKAVWEKSRPKDLGKSKPLSPSQKASAKAAAKAAGRPYPNLIDNMRAARKADGGQVEGNVQFAPTDLPMMAQHPDVEIENALRAARSAEPAKKEYAPFSVLPLREDESGIHFDPNAGVIGGVKRAGKYFYDTMSGRREMDPTSQEAVEAASNIAGITTLGAGAMERPVGSLAAGVDKRFLENLAEQYRAHYDPSARILGQPRKEWLSSVKLSRPIEEMRVSSTEHRPMVAERFTEPEEYAGKAMITGLGDRTPAGYEITGINDRELTAPVNMMGGAAFGRDIASLGPDRAVWGSALSRAQAIGNKARAAAEKGYEPVFTYVAQGPASGDFSHHMQDLVLGQVRPEKMDPKLAETIDRRMRESQTGSGETFAPKPEWVGIRSPEMASRMKERADERVKLIKLMDSAAYRDAPGFADVGAARFASTDPSLLHDPSFSAGKAFMSIDPKGSVVRNPVNPHPSYDTFLSAAPGRHGYLGRLEYELPPELHFKHYLENEIKPELRGKPLDKQTMSLLRQHPTVIATPEWVDAASSWQNFMRSRYGSRRP